MNHTNQNKLKPFREKPWLWGETWGIGVINRSFMDLLANPQQIDEVQWLKPPWPNGYCSDPWLVRHNDDFIVFFEHYDTNLQRGRLACATLSSAQDKWELSSGRHIVNEPHHLSHPCVFQHDNKWFLLPEAADTGHVVMYEAIDFPYQWAEAKIIIPGFPGLDPTYFRNDRGSWIFSNCQGKNHNANLHLFHSDNLCGPWTPNSSNPITTDLRGARPAGPLVNVNGQLIRPGQNSSLTYGQSILLHQVNELSREFYREEALIELSPAAPSAFPNGIHSLCAEDNFCLVDGKKFTGLKYFLAPPLMRWRKSRQGRQ